MSVCFIVNWFNWERIHTYVLCCVVYCILLCCILLVGAYFLLAMIRYCTIIIKCFSSGIFSFCFIELANAMNVDYAKHVEGHLLSIAVYYS